MPRPRISLRWMMLTVSVVALLLFGVQTWRTRQDRLLKAAMYRQEERDWRKTHLLLQNRLARGRDANRRYARMSDEALRRELEGVRFTSENHRIWADYTLRLARWYERGASRPWRSLGQKPPIPREIDGTTRK